MTTTIYLSTMPDPRGTVLMFVSCPGLLRLRRLPQPDVRGPYLATFLAVLLKPAQVEERHVQPQIPVGPVCHNWEINNPGVSADVFLRLGLGCFPYKLLVDVRKRRVDY